MTVPTKHPAPDPNRAKLRVTGVTVSPLPVQVCIMSSGIEGVERTTQSEYDKIVMYCIDAYLSTRCLFLEPK